LLFNISSGVMSARLSFIFDHPIIRKTVKYIDQSNNSQHELSFNTGKLITDWSVENRNLETLM
jgi:hypothetical protein